MDPKRMKRIIVATDFSELSNEAVETAVALAHESGAIVDLVHVATEIVYAVPPPMDVLSVPVDMPSVVRAAAARLAKEEDRVRDLGVICEGNVLVGRAETQIVDHADKTRSDLIVLGTHGRTGLGHALMGSTAEKVVQHAHCPVLTVPQRQPPRAA
ncbi:MAG TPA: universal stress protein [Polyangia bacterium]|jgi:nucleotide-binding universal stress UspA family protein|nr:universal stress protein [Polyangia bacterium]